jgi:hypothetical protein
LRQNFRRRRAADGERGAAFIEFALSVPFLLLIAMGIVEMGLGWMAANDVNATVRDAARAGTSAPAYLTSDRTILVAIGTGLTPSELAGLKKVVVFKADSSGRPTDNSCLNTNPNDGSPGSAAGVGDNCNVYGPKQVAYAVAHPTNATAWGGAADQKSCTTTEIDQLWCPAKRNHSQANNALDNLGVYVELKHSSVTHFSFGDMTIKRQAVFRLEPNYGGS